MVQRVHNHFKHNCLFNNSKPKRVCITDKLIQKYSDQNNIIFLWFIKLWNVCVGKRNFMSPLLVRCGEVGLHNVLSHALVVLAEHLCVCSISVLRVSWSVGEARELRCVVIIDWCARASLVNKRQFSFMNGLLFIELRAASGAAGRGWSRRCVFLSGPSFKWFRVLKLF